MGALFLSRAVAIAFGVAWIASTASACCVLGSQCFSARDNDLECEGATNSFGEATPRCDLTAGACVTVPGPRPPVAPPPPDEPPPPFDPTACASRALFSSADGGDVIRLIDGTVELVGDDLGCADEPGTTRIIAVTSLGGAYELAIDSETLNVSNETVALAVAGDFGARRCTTSASAFMFTEDVAEPCDGLSSCMIVCDTCVERADEDAAIQVIDDAGNTSNAVCLRTVE